MSLNFETLKTKQRQLRENFPESLTLRVHRALSWFGRAEKESEDCDVGFILLWISFNAAYAEEIDQTSSEQGAYMRFFNTLLALDRKQTIYSAVWNKFSQEISLILENQHIFAPYWRYKNGNDFYADWQERLIRANDKAKYAIRLLDTSTILSIVFDRLYVLRNQLVHGGATWNSAVNRYQVEDGYAFLTYIMPLIIDIMMDNPIHDWGMPFYTVVE